jgi:hypothetical protein
MRKNLWEGVGKKHAIKVYNTSKEFQTIVDLMAALPYVRSDKISGYYNLIIEPLIDQLPEDIPIEALDYVSYFERTYVGRRAGRTGNRRAPIYSPDLWSVFCEVLADHPTTNNAMEAFNSQWNAAKLPSDTFWSVIEGFKREDALAKERYLQEIISVQHPELCPDEGRKRKIAQRAKMERLINLCGKFDSISPTEFLYSVNAVIKKA